MSIEMDAKVAKSSAHAVATAMTTRILCIAAEVCAGDEGIVGCASVTKL
jgi:hypothetical protein